MTIQKLSWPVIRHITSYCPTYEHNDLALISKSFNEIICGIYEGKRAKLSYLLGPMIVECVKVIKSSKGECDEHFGKLRKIIYIAIVCENPKWILKIGESFPWFFSGADRFVKEVCRKGIFPYHGKRDLCGPLNNRNKLHPPLHLAAIIGNVEVVKALIAIGFESNCAIDIHHYRGLPNNNRLDCIGHDMTPLYIAVLEGHVELTRFLVKKITLSKDESFETPMDAACRTSNYVMVELLLKHDYRIRSSKSKAVIDQHIEFMKMCPELYPPPSKRCIVM